MLWFCITIFHVTPRSKQDRVILGRSRRYKDKGLLLEVLKLCIRHGFLIGNGIAEFLGLEARDPEALAAKCTTFLVFLLRVHASLVSFTRLTHEVQQELRQRNRDEP